MARKALIALLALVSSAVPSTLHAQDVEGTPWYPLKVGAKWHYRVVPPNPAGSNNVVLRVDKLEPVEFMGAEGKPEKILAFRLVGKSEDRELVEHVAVTPRGVFRIMGDKVKMPPLMILKLPLVQGGDAWECDIPLAGGGELKGKFTSKEEVSKVPQEIKVPGGKLKVFKTEYVKSEDVTVGSHKMSAEYWFAADVGIVKQKIKWGTLTQALELVEFEPGK